jgi:alkylhydroperoxidase family enzyme
MTRLAYPDPAYVAQVILRVTHRTHAHDACVRHVALVEQMRSVLSPREIVELLVVVGWYWTVGHLMTSLDLEPEPAPTVPGTHTLQMSA